jgi:hypothetical protein
MASGRQGAGLGLSLPGMLSLVRRLMRGCPPRTECGRELSWRNSQAGMARALSAEVWKGLAWAKSRRLVRMKRPALPSVRGA